MTDETRIIRTVGIPIIIAVIFLFVIPKTCQKAFEGRRARIVAATGTDAPAGSPPTGDGSLHIQSETPGAAPLMRGELHFPPGLDAQRAQYLIEVDRKFAEPYVLAVPKPGGAPQSDSSRTDALVSAGYFQAVGAGFVPTREGAMHIDGIEQDATSYRVPIGKRKFGRIRQTEDLGDGKLRVIFTWEWEPTDAGRAIKTALMPHDGTAEFGGGGEHAWDLNSVTIDSDWR